MPTEDLAARSRAIAAENEQKVLIELSAAYPGALRGGDLAELAGLAPRTTTAVVARLEEKGLATRDGKRAVLITPAGRTQVGAGMLGVSLGSALDEAIGCFPSEALRAFIRLLLGAIVARWHLAREYDSGWPGFISIGETKTGKTSIALLVCRILGLTQLEAIWSAFRQTPGSLIGRRVQDGTSATGWRVERSPALALPFVCIDEWSRASREVQQAAGGLLLGATVDQLEGERFELQPTVYLTLDNPAGLRALDPAHVRRSIVLDTTPLLPLLSDLDVGVHAFQSGRVAVPRLRLDRLRPPARALPDDLRELLRTELRAGLTDEGLRHSDVEPLARIALGSAALPDGSLERSVLTTVYDYLVVAETVGQARAGYAGRLAPRLGDGALRPDPDAAQRQREELLARRLQHEIAQKIEGDRRVAKRGYLEQMLTETIDMLDRRKLKNCSPQQRMLAWSLAEMLRGIRADVTSARTGDALEIAEARVRNPLQLADALNQEIQREAAISDHTAARLAPVLRSRRPELAPARSEASLIQRMLSGAHGTDLEVLDQRSQQLEAAPPWTDSERRRDMAARSMLEVRLANRNPSNYG